MFKVTRFCVQPYVRRGARLVADEAQQFNLLPLAEQTARQMLRRVAGVAVFEVTGWPVQNLWAEPRLLEAFGAIPADA